MQYTLLGNTGLTVSRLAFGAMTFTAGNKAIGAVYKVGAELAGELVGRALEAGINLFDTADGYAGGESEALLGAALKSRRDEVVIATKVGFRTGAALTRAGLSRRHILWSVDQSLKRLGTDWIDVYIAHREAGRRGRLRRHSRSKRRTGWRSSPTGRCTTPWSGGTSSATSFP